MKKTIWTIVVLAVLVLIAIAMGGGKKMAETGPIKIGFIGPLTGDAASYGEVVKNGTYLAAKEINDNGGVNGRQIEITYEDGKCNGKDSASAASKLIGVDKVKFLLVGECSGGLFGVAPIAEQGKVLVLASIATNPKVADAGDYIFRNAPNDDARGVALADYASTLYKKVAIISEQTDYAQGLKTTFLNEAKVKNLTVVANEDFTTDTKDFRSIITKVKSSGAEVIFINPQTGGALVRIAQQARQLGITVPFIGSEFNGPEVIAAEKDVEGMVVSVAPGLSAEGKGKLFLDNYVKEFGKEPAYAYYAGAAYDDLMILAQGIEKTAEDATKVKNWLYSMGNYDGTIGTYSFDKKGELVGIKFIFQKLENGKFVEMK